jgi:hypothetical protein
MDVSLKTDLEVLYPEDSCMVWLRLRRAKFFVVKEIPAGSC